MTSGLDSNYSANSSGLSSTGNTVGVPLFPVVAGNAWYGFPANFRTFTSGTGSSAGIEDRHFKVSSGTDTLGYGTIQSFRSLNFRTGASASVRVSGRFGTPVAGTWSGIGAFSIGDEVSFGYSGTDFGVWHRHGGIAEVRTLTVSAAATGAETLTLTLNGTGYSIALTNGTINHNINEIVAWMDANQSAWDSQAQDTTIIFSAKSDAAKSGSYSFSSTGTAAGSFAQTTAGVTKTSTHVPQSEWNGDIPGGFDPQNGQNYQIDYENGNGDIIYKIRDYHLGRYMVAHVIRGSDTTLSNMQNPCLPVGCYAYSVGATTNIDVYAAYLTAFSEAVESQTRNPRGYVNTKSIDTTPTNLLTLRNRRTYSGFINQAEIAPVFLTLANDGSKTAVFELRGNPTVAGTPVFSQPGTNLISDIDTAGTTVTQNGRLFGAFPVAKGQSVVINLSELRIRVPPTLRLVVSGSMTSGAAADLTANLVWYEDIA